MTWDRTNAEKRREQRGPGEQSAQDSLGLGLPVTRGSPVTACTGAKLSWGGTPVVQSLTCKSMAAASCWYPSCPCGAGPSSPAKLWVGPSHIAGVSGRCPKDPFLEKQHQMVTVFCSLSLPQLRQPDSVQDLARGGQGLFRITSTDLCPVYPLQCPRWGWAYDSTGPC